MSDDSDSEAEEGNKYVGTDRARSSHNNRPEVRVSPGAVLVGLFISVLTLYALYIQNYQFAGWLMLLLVILSLSHTVIMRD